MSDPRRWSEAEMLELAARGLGKVDSLGQRGIERVTNEEIAAMAGVLAIIGLTPIRPGPSPDVTKHRNGVSK